MKRKFLNIVFVLFITFLMVGCGCNKKEVKKEKKDSNLNKPVITYKNVGDLKFGTASFYISDNKTYINTSIINETNKDIEIKQFNILLKDSSNKVIKTINVKIEKIKSKETKEILEEIDGTFFETNSIDYEIK